MIAPLHGEAMRVSRRGSIWQRCPSTCMGATMHPVATLKAVQGATSSMYRLPRVPMASIAAAAAWKRIAS